MSEEYATSPRWLKPARQTYVALQAREPAARTFLISGVGCDGSASFAGAMASIMTAAGTEVSVLRLGVDSVNASDDDASEDLMRLDKLVNLDFARTAVRTRARAGYLLASAEDFVGVPRSVLLAPAVDGVILLAQVGKTTHRALREARGIITATGASLIGSICIERDE